MCWRGRVIGLWLVGAAMGCAHHASHQAMPMADGHPIPRPLVVWERTGMLGGTRIDFALYPDGRVFFPAPQSGQYVFAQLTSAERDAFLTEVPLIGLASLPEERIVDASDYAWDRVTVATPSGRRTVKEYGASDWYLNRAAFESAGWQPSPSAVAALRPFWSFLDAVRALRPRANRDWRPVQVRLDLEPSARAATSAPTPSAEWPSDLLEVEVRHPCDGWRRRGAFVPDTYLWVDAKLGQRLQPIIAAHNGAFSIQGCPYQVRMYSPLPGEPQW